jgi:glycosyltransferase involved in cell wall biosynthesis
MARYLLYTAGNYKTTRVTGGTKRFKEIVQYLLDEGEEVHLIAPGDIEFPQYKKLNIIPIKVYKSNILPNGLLNYFLNIRVFRKVKNMDFDRTVIVSIPYGIQAVLAGFKNITLIIWEDIIDYRTIHYKDERIRWIGYLKSLVLPVYKRIERYTLKRVRQIIVQCNYDKEVLISRHKDLKEDIEDKTRILFNNVNTSWLTRHKDLIDSHGENINNMTTMVFVGNLNDQRKGLHLLLEATAGLLKKKLPVKLKIIGDGKLRRYYEDQYKNYPEIQFLGKLNDPVPEINRANLMVVPSQADSFPNTVLEGLFLEIPVLGAKKGGIPEILNYPELLFESDPKALADKLEDFIRNDREEQYRTLSRKRKEALTFNWEKAIKEIIDD